MALKTSSRTLVCMIPAIWHAVGAQGIVEDPPSSFIDTMATSFWVALGLAAGVILGCFCCLICLKSKGVRFQQNSLSQQRVTDNQDGEEGDVHPGMANQSFEFSEPPPPYSDALKYTLSHDENPPAYTESYL